MASDKNQIRRTNCACTKCTLFGVIGTCAGFVVYDALEWAKAKRLYDENPVDGFTGEGRRPYKLCGPCQYGVCHKELPSFGY